MKSSVLSQILGLAALALLLAPQARAQDADHVTYHVVQGDTLISISERFLIGDNAVPKIARLNRIGNPRRIPIGTEISLPRELLAFRSANLRVLSFSGPVQVDSVLPRNGDRLDEGAVVQTGRNGFISLRADDGSTISFPSMSRARLERARIYRLNDLRDIEFHILQGRGEVDVPELRNEERFRTSTPFAVTSVRGTQFRVASNPDSGTNITEVVEGSVNVESEGGAGITNAGFAMIANADEIGSAEQLLPSGAVINAAEVQIEEQITFALRAPTGAQASRTQIARDAGFLDVISEQFGDEEEVQFEALDDGRFFVRSRGIAQSGAEGLSDVYAFRRKRLGVSAIAEADPLADGFRFAWRPIGAGPILFAFQLWQEGADAMLIDEIGLPGEARVVSKLEPGTYQWRVAALQADEGDYLKAWGPVQRLIVSN